MEDIDYEYLKDDYAVDELPERLINAIRLTSHLVSRLTGRDAGYIETTKGRGYLDDEGEDDGDHFVVVSFGGITKRVIFDEEWDTVYPMQISYVAFDLFWDILDELGFELPEYNAEIFSVLNSAVMRRA